MAFTIASAPHGHSQQTTSTMMRLVLLALLPGVVVQIYFFGYGVLIQLLLAAVTALLTEALVLLLRRRAIRPHLADSSALLTAALLAVALPPLAPWWLVVSGTASIKLRKVGEDADGNPFPVDEYTVSGSDMRAVEMIPGYTHSITNLSDTEDLVTVMWANEPFDPESPDTYYEEV